MPNPFTDAVTTNIGSTLAEVGAGQTEIPSALPPATIDRTARLAAVALNPNQITQNYSALTAKYAEDIKATGDQQVRYQAAAQETESNLKGIYSTINQAPEMDPSGQLTSDLQAAAKAEMDASFESKAHYALEKRAFENIQNLAAGGDYTQAKVLMDSIKYGSADDQIRDINVKRMMINTAVEKAGVAEKDQPWFKHVTDFVASSIGSMTFKESWDRGGNVNIDGSLQHWWDFILSGDRQRNEAAALWSQDPATFGRTLNEQVIPAIQAHASNFGYYNHSEALNLLSGIADTPSKWQTNMGDAMNLVGLLPLGAITKAASIPSLMIRAGARKEAADLIANATLESIRSGTENAAKATGISEAEVVAGNTPTALNPDLSPINTVPLTGDTLAAVERGKAIAEKIPELNQAVQSGRMTMPEYEIAVQKQQERISAQYGRALKDFRIENESLTSGQNVGKMVFDFGKKKGGGFASETIAEQQARAMGVGTHEIVQDESGQFFVRETRDMDETSFYTTNLNPGLKNTGIVGRYLLGARQVDDDFTFELARKSANARNKIMVGVRNDFSKRFTGVLQSDEGDFLRNAAAWGENNKTWLARDEMDELFSRQGAKAPVSDKAWDAYNAMRDINDLEYVMRNDVEYAARRLKGMESVNFDGYGFKADGLNAIIDRHPQSMPEAGEARIFDLSTGVHYTKSGNPLLLDRFKQMADDGYALVSLEEPIDAGGTTVKHFMIKKGELEAERLRRDQIPYSAGGHRLYADKYFAKQASWGVQSDTKEKFLKSPNTFMSGTKAEVQYWANTMERARQMYTAKADKSVLDETLAPLDGWDGERFTKLVEDGKIDPNSPITAMYDREMPHEYIQTPTAAQFHNADENGYTGWLRTNGRMYYSAKGEALQDWRGELARTVDPFETANRGIENIANLASFSDYKISAVTRWVDTYREYLATGHLPKGASDLTVFADAKYNANLDQMPMGAGDRIRQQMEAQAAIIKRNLGWKTDWDRRMERWQANINSFVMGDNPTTARHEFGRQLTNWWSTSNPINAVRGFVFDTKMGFFNVAQFPLQIQTVLSTAALAGIEHAGPAFMNMPLMRRFLMGREINEHFIDLGISTGMHTAAGMEAEDYRVMMRMAKKSGFFEIQNSHQLMNYNGPSAVLGGVQHGYQQAMQNGRWFFNEGEMWNRIMAWQVAFKDVAKSIRYPDRVGNDAHIQRFFEEFSRKVEARADDYSLNMTKESGAPWQQGLLSIPTQFWAYNARMMEAYFGKQFTGAQKLRLAVAQTFFYGAAGVPIASVASDFAKAKQGGAFPIDSVYGMIDRGAIDEVIYHMTGADVTAGKRYGTGSWMGDIVGTMFGMSPYGEKSFADVVGGSTYQILGSTMKTMKDVVKYISAESGTGDYPLTKDGVLRMLNNISTFSYGFKAYYAYQYQAYISNTGTVVADNLPKADAAFFALGIAPAEQDDIAAMMAWKKDRKTQVDDVAKLIVNQRARLAIEPQHRDEISEEINAAMRLLPPDLRTKALKEANHRTPGSLHTTLGQQIEQEKQQQEQMSRYGQTN